MASACAPHTMLATPKLPKTKEGALAAHLETLRRALRRQLPSHCISFVREYSTVSLFMGPAPKCSKAQASVETQTELRTPRSCGSSASEQGVFPLTVVQPPSQTPWRQNVLLWFAVSASCPVQNTCYSYLSAMKVLQKLTFCVQGHAPRPSSPGSWPVGSTCDACHPVSNIMAPRGALAA